MAIVPLPGAIPSAHARHARTSRRDRDPFCAVCANELGARRGEGAVAGGFAPTPVLGHVPAADGATFAYWEAACGLANEKGVMLAESTCSAIFGADVRASAAAPYSRTRRAGVPS